MAQNNTRTLEDKIIDDLILGVASTNISLLDDLSNSITNKTNKQHYEDADFLPIRQSLYNVGNIVPLYDDEISSSIM